jgi:hypothetical protein
MIAKIVSRERTEMFECDRCKYEWKDGVLRVKVSKELMIWEEIVYTLTRGQRKTIYFLEDGRTVDSAEFSVK